MTNSNGHNEHHFVPQFYLRRFSQDEKSINLFNFAKDLYIPKTSIRNQCSKRKYYDFAPELETQFSELEGLTAETLRQIIDTQKPPVHFSDEWAGLIGFIIFQRLRTTNSGAMNNAMTDYFGKLMAENSPELADIDLSSIQIEDVYPTAIPLSVAGDMLPYAESLRMQLLVNKTKREFITCDDPVVLHNQFCEQVRIRGVLGWNCSGLQVFWPISPKELILLYDPDIYTASPTTLGEQTTRITQERDVAQLNKLQILNAHHNIYFKGASKPDTTLSHARMLADERPESRTTFVETEEKETNDGDKVAIIHSYPKLLPLSLSISKLRIRKHCLKIETASRGTMQRQPVMHTHEEKEAFGTPPSGRYAVKRVIHK